MAFSALAVLRTAETCIFVAPRQDTAQADRQKSGFSCISPPAFAYLCNRVAPYRQGAPGGGMAPPPLRHHGKRKDPLRLQRMRRRLAQVARTLPLVRRLEYAARVPRGQACGCKPHTPTRFETHAAARLPLVSAGRRRGAHRHGRRRTEPRARRWTCSGRSRPARR